MASPQEAVITWAGLRFLTFSNLEATSEAALVADLLSSLLEPCHAHQNLQISNVQKASEAASALLVFQVLKVRDRFHDVSKAQTWDKMTTSSRGLALVSQTRD
jgi:hypothetical protein